MTVRPSPGRNTGRRGLASMLAIVLLAVLATLGLALGQLALGELAQADNAAASQEAHLAAESGLNVLCWALRQMNVPRSVTGEDLAAAVAQGLASKLEGQGLAPGSITASGTAVIVPIVQLDEHQRFNARLTVRQDNTLQVAVCGRSGQAVRTLALNAEVQAGSNPIFGFGIASRSAIRMTGNASVEGVNDPAEATMYSGTQLAEPAFDLTGNVSLDGDLHIANPNGYVEMTGNIEIAGKRDADEIAQHVHIGVGEAEFPEVDPTVFEPFATNVVDSSTSVSGNKTFNNIRIKAGTNPNFSGNITINGVVFIEQPNKVKFTGNLTMKGVIVTQDAGDEAYDENTINFAGNSSFSGVETLPDTPQFAQLRQMPGSFLLAPGFGVHFAGNFGTIGGTMAADEYKWVGNASGVVKGMVINYSQSAFVLTGNSRIRIDRSTSQDVPPGFLLPRRVEVKPATYVELRGEI